MILIDTNILVYAHVTGFPRHEAARERLDERLNTVPQVALPLPSLLGFLRITTNPRIFERPEPVEDAWAQAEAWIAAPSACIPAPTAGHSELLGGLIDLAPPSANLIPDAHLAVLAIEHGLTLCGTDGDFGRFPGLSWKNPLAGQGDN